MSIIQDAKGRPIPSWARYVKPIDASTAFSGYKDTSGNYVPFGIYLEDAATVVFNVVEGFETEHTFTFGAGYHPIAFATLTSSTKPVLALYAYKPSSA